MQSPGKTRKKALPEGREPCLCSAVRKASRRISAIYDAELAELGVSITNYSLLARIDAEDGVAISELAEIMCMERTTLTRNLQPLLRDGLIEPLHTGDRRRKALRTTRKGQALLKRAYKNWQRAQARCQTLYGAEPTRALLGAVESILRAPSR